MRPTRSWAGVLLHAVGAVALLAALLNVGLAFRDARGTMLRTDACDAELKRLKQLNAERRAQICALRDDPGAIERERQLRSPLRPGEERVPPR